MKRFYEWKTGAGHTMRRVFVIGNYNHSIEAFSRLAAQIKTDFPDAAPERIDCGTVTRSDSIKGHALATWYVPEGVEVPADYDRCGDNVDFAW